MSTQKTIADNRKARHDYELYDRYEAGLELKGTEIKSIRRGKVQLKDSYISFYNNEAYIKGMHISPYELGIFLIMTKQETENYFYIKKKFENSIKTPVSSIQLCL